MLINFNFSSNAANLTYYNSGILDKPVILVEGFDPINELNAADYNELLPQNFKDWLSNSGRDLVIMTFDNYALDLKLLADEFKDSLIELNTAKTGNHPNAVIGFSAGGLIARWGLKDMEDLDVEHDVSVFISYDTPHRGATIPESIIDGLKDLKDKLPGMAEPDNLKLNWNKVNAYSAKQMLIGGSYSSFLTDIENKGYPNNLARFAIANGSNNGSEINLPTKAVVYDYKVEILQVNSEYQTLKEESHDPCSYPCDPVRNKRYDKAPGGTRNTFEVYWLAMDEADADNAAWKFDLDVYYKNTALKNHSFVNTLSALDIKNFEITDAITTTMEDYSPFDDYGHTSTNKPHDSIDSSFANGNDGKINIWLQNYHKTGALIPNRNHKKINLPKVSSLHAEWIVAGRNLISWDSVSGATRYEIHLKTTNGYTLIYTSTGGLFNSIIVDLTSQIAVRACNDDQCGYSVFATAYNRQNQFPF